MAELSGAQNTLLKIKKHVPFFSKLSDGEIISVTHDVQFKKYNKFEVVFEQDATEEEAYIVLRGVVNISVGEFQRIGLLERFANFKTVINLPAKSVFGEMSAITGEKRTARATAYAPETLLLSFKIDDDINEENADVFIKMYKELIEIISDKLRKTNEAALQKKNK